MAFQLLFSGALTIFFAYCFIYIGAIAPEPQPDMMDGAQWPQLLLALLVFCLILNMVNIVRKTPPAERNFGALRRIDVAKLLKNKLFLGIVALFAYALILDYLGFIATTFLFCMAYSRLLGEKRIARLLAYSMLIVVVLYAVFSLGLDIMLPRGVGIFRNFALMIESL